MELCDPHYPICPNMSFNIKRDTLITDPQIILIILTMIGMMMKDYRYLHQIMRRAKGKYKIKSDLKIFDKSSYFSPFFITFRQSCVPTMSSLIVIIVFLLASSYLLYFASTRPLVDVSITGISDILAADKELIFNIHVKGRNYGLWNIEIVRSDLTVFATPVRNSVPGGIPGGPGSHWDDAKDDEPISEVTPSELGSILLFDEPLVFAAGFNKTGVVSEPSGQVRLRNPGGENDEGQERWYVQFYYIF
jgi:hypothetical protein